MRKLLAILVTLALLCAAAPAVMAETALSDDIVILYTNDVHT